MDIINKKLFSILVILLSFTCIGAQQKESELSGPIPFTIRNFKNLSALSFTDSKEFSSQKIITARSASVFASRSKPDESFQMRGETDFEEIEAGEAKINRLSERKIIFQSKAKEKFHWKPALIQSGIFLGIQHGFRMFQRKTREHLGGPFFRDWTQSVKNLRGWRDGDNAFTNYVAHPLQGGVTGRIFINTSDRAKRQEFGKSKEYWESRFKAMLWSAAWSTQFEFGPISEANLGNVGLREKNGYSTAAWVDLIITPTVGTGVVIIEDAFDKYLLKNWIEKKMDNKVMVKIFRFLFTPTTGFSNLLRGKKPWYRDNRPL